MTVKGAFRMEAQYNGKCCECKEPIEPGDTIVYSPGEKRTYCIECGTELLGEDKG